MHTLSLLDAQIITCSSWLPQLSQDVRAISEAYISTPLPDPQLSSVPSPWWWWAFPPIPQPTSTIYTLHSHYTISPVRNSDGWMTYLSLWLSLLKLSLSLSSFFQYELSILHPHCFTACGTFPPMLPPRFFTVHGTLVNPLKFCFPGLWPMNCLH